MVSHSFGERGRMRVALDYNNLPLLLTVSELATLFRCSVGTMRKKLKDDPAWLPAVDHGVIRRQLFARDDALRLLGQDVTSPAPAVSAASMGFSSWDGDAAKAEIIRTRRARINEQSVQRDQQRREAQRQLIERAADHLPTQRAIGLSIVPKVDVQSNDAWDAFRVTIRFRKNHRPDGWPEAIAIPRTGPEWIPLATDAERDAIREEIDVVLAEYESVWRSSEKRQRLGKKKAPEGSSEA